MTDTKNENKYYICHSRYIRKDGTVKVYKQRKVRALVPRHMKAKTRVRTEQKNEIKKMVSACKDADVIKAIYDYVQTKIIPNYQG